MTSVTLGELDRAMGAYRKALKRKPRNETRAVLEAIKSFEKDRRLADERK